MRFLRLTFGLLLVAALGAGFWWWRVGRGPEVAAAAATRGTAVEIVYATGAVEPVRCSPRFTNGVTTKNRQRPHAPET